MSGLPDVKSLDDVSQQHNNATQSNNPFVNPVLDGSALPPKSSARQNSISAAVNRAAASLPGHPPKEMSHASMAPGGKVRVTSYVSSNCLFWSRHKKDLIRLTHILFPLSLPLPMHHFPPKEVAASATFI